MLFVTSCFLIQPKAKRRKRWNQLNVTPLELKFFWLVGFVPFGQKQANCFPLFPVCMLSYANQLLAVNISPNVKTPLTLKNWTSCKHRECDPTLCPNFLLHHFPVCVKQAEDEHDDQKCHNTDSLQRKRHESLVCHVKHEHVPDIC